MKKFNGTPGEWLISFGYLTTQKIKEENSCPIATLHGMEDGKNNAEKIIEAKANHKLIIASKILLEALQYYNDGIEHFYKCIDFGKSNLDAKAIEFMNESNIKIKKAINKAL